MYALKKERERVVKKMYLSFTEQVLVHRNSTANGVVAECCCILLCTAYKVWPVVNHCSLKLCVRVFYSQL